MAAKLCRGVGDRFFESIYENKTAMITNKAIVILKKRQILSFVVLKNGIHRLMEKGSWVTAIGLVEIN